MASEAGKGSKQRPTDRDAYSKGWDAIFGRNKTEKPVDKKEEKK